jgi:O-6-methylguanine DNA methyltransferase
MNKAYYKSPLGWIEIIADDKYLLSMSFIKNKQGRNATSLVLNKIIKQLDEYFQHKRKKFDIAIKLDGTVWQNLVWQELVKIPYGSIISYQDLAKMVGKPQAARAIGNAVNKNKIGIIVPCHRVIGSNAKLVGYEGGLWRKKWLLEHEV